MSRSVRCLYDFEGFRLNPAERLLAHNGVPVPLPPKAFEMLVVLVSNSGHLLTKEELMGAIWPDTVVEENNLDKAISALRKALGESSAEAKLIETVRGHGYRFRALVTEIVDDQNNDAQQTRGSDESVGARSLRQSGGVARTTDRSRPPVLGRRDAGTPSGFRRGTRGPGLAIMLLLAVVATVRFWPLKKGIPDPPHAIKATRLTNGGYIHDAVISPDGNYFAYTEQDGAAASLWIRQVGGGQPVTLVPQIEQSILGLTFAPDGHNIYFVTAGQGNPRGTLFRVADSGGQVTELLTGIASPVAFAPSGRRFAFIRLEGQLEDVQGTSLVVADVTGHNERVVQTRSAVERFGRDGLSWSPDGREIACQLMSSLTKTSDDVWRIVGVNIASGEQRMLTTQQWDGCGRIVWLRDGRGIVLVGTRKGESGTTARDSIWFVSQPDGVVRRITNDLSRHYYGSVSATDDGQSLLVIPFNRTSQIWALQARGHGEQISYDAHTALQLTTGTSDGRSGIVSLVDGHIVYVARTGEHVDLWQLNQDGSEPRQLTTTPQFLEEVSAPADGRYFVFASNSAGYSHLFRVLGDGADLRQLTSGTSREIDSDCSPDGRWVVYSSQSSLPDEIGPINLWKMPAEGGAPVRLTDGEAHSPRFSPDGEQVSYVYRDGAGQRVAIIASDGGEPVKTFEAPNATETSVGYRWTPDGRALVYVVKRRTFDNLWVQPLSGGAAHALTDFDSGEIYNYAFARDGQRVFLARGYSIRDVTLITDFR